MQFILVFLEGILAFVSPPFLLMLPVYAGYFLGGGKAFADDDFNMDEGSFCGSMRKYAALRATGFVLGFLSLFIFSGVFSDVSSVFFSRHQVVVDIIAGATFVFIGLVFMGVASVPFFSGVRGRWQGGGFGMATLMGMAFFCAGRLYAKPHGSSSVARTLSTQEPMFVALSLGIFSAGLAIVMVLGAVLLGQLRTSFGWFYRHSDVVAKISGGVLVVSGLATMSGLLGRAISYLS